MTRQIRESPDAGSLRLGNSRGRMDDEKTCRLEGMEGRVVAGPKDACLFWEPAGLAHWLLEFRHALEALE